MLADDHGRFVEAQPAAAARGAREIVVLLVDERCLLREAFAQALEAAAGDLRVRRFADPAELTAGDLAGEQVVVVLGTGGFDRAEERLSAALAALGGRLAGRPVVALSESERAEDILAASEHGLKGYIPLTAELPLVVEALRFVAAGGTYLPAEPLLDDLSTAREEAARALATAPAVDCLTVRERAVLRVLCRGKSNKEIARDLDLCEATVKVHLRHIMRKLGAANRTQVVLLAERVPKIVGHS